MSDIWELELASPRDNYLLTKGGAGAYGKVVGPGVRAHRTEICTQRYQIPRPESPFLSLSSWGRRFHLLAAVFTSIKWRYQYLPCRAASRVTCPVLIRKLTAIGGAFAQSKAHC